MCLTDIHSHFVYGVDDGADSYDMMCLLLDQANENNIRHLVSTPHMTPGVYPFNMDLYLSHFHQAQEYCRFKGYDIHLYYGAQLLYTPAMDGFISAHRLTTLSFNDHVLIQYAPTISLQDLSHSLQNLEYAGYDTIIAHVERYRCLAHMNSLAKLRKQFPNVLFQLNANTILQQHSLINDLRINHWLQNGEIDYVASDAHHPQERPFLNWKTYQLLKQKLIEEYVQILFSHC